MRDNSCPNRSLSSVDLARAQATRANSNGLGGTVYDSLNLADVGLPASVRLTMGVGDRLSENNALTTDTTLCHNDTSLYALIAHLS